MGRPPSDKELKRMGRVLAGHRTDKDRARWLRKAKGEAVAMKQPRKSVTLNDEAPDEGLEAREDAPDEERWKRSCSFSSETKSNT